MRKVRGVFLNQNFNFLVSAFLLLTRDDQNGNSSPSCRPNVALNSKERIRLSKSVNWAKTLTTKPSNTTLLIIPSLLQLLSTFCLHSVITQQWITQIQTTLNWVLNKNLATTTTATVANIMFLEKRPWIEWASPISLWVVLEVLVSKLVILWISEPVCCLFFFLNIFIMKGFSTFIFLSGELFVQLSLGILFFGCFMTAFTNFKRFIFLFAPHFTFVRIWNFWCFWFLLINNFFLFTLSCQRKMLLLLGWES